mgnify:CR=1 FL=1
MNKKEFYSIIKPVYEYYSKAPTPAAVDMFYGLVEKMEAKHFAGLIKEHMNRPDQGKYFPTKAHLLEIENERLSSNIINATCPKLWETK